MGMGDGFWGLGMDMDMDNEIDTLVRMACGEILLIILTRYGIDFTFISHSCF